MQGRFFFRVESRVGKDMVVYAYHISHAVLIFREVVTHNFYCDIDSAVLRKIELDDPVNFAYRTITRVPLKQLPNDTTIWAVDDDDNVLRFKPDEWV